MENPRTARTFRSLVCQLHPGSYVTATFALPDSATTPSCCIDPAFHHLPAGKPRDADSVAGDLLSRGGNPIQLTFVGASATPAGNDRFPFRKEFLERQAEILECDRASPFSSHSLVRAHIWRRSIMVSITRAEELVCHLQLTLVPNLFEQTTNDYFVGFRQPRRYSPLKAQCGACLLRKMHSDYQAGVSP
jgi:hypothetical protein